MEQRIKPAIQEFLAVRGLELSIEKTHLTHIANGFDFLGQNSRKYNGKLLIKPSKKNVEVFLAKIKKAIKERTAARPIEVLEKLAPMIRGWVMYHRHIVAKQTFRLFKYGKEKACVIHEVSPFLESEKILEVGRKIWIPGFVSEDHIIIGEEIGIKREWIAESISRNELIGECNTAWITLGNLVGEAHDILGYDFKFTDHCHKSYKDFQIMTESQLDPSLPEKWGWNGKKKSRRKKKN